MGVALSQLANTLFHVSTGAGDPAGVIPTVFSWITSSAVLPYLAIGIGCSLCLFGIRAIKSVIWGA